MLSEREEQVLSLLTDGLTNRAIAHRLGITERTAREHVARILLKLGVRSRVEAAVFATERKRGCSCAASAAPASMTTAPRPWSGAMRSPRRPMEHAEPMTGTRNIITAAREDPTSRTPR
jgi:DNA-binding CsgD family transcriptional regulator